MEESKFSRRVLKIKAASSSASSLIHLNQQ
jgi:hypothetical protein